MFLCKLFGHRFDEKTIIKVDIKSSLILGEMRPYDIIVKIPCKRCGSTLDNSFMLRHNNDARVLKTNLFESINSNR